MNEEIFQTVLNEILDEMKVFSLRAKDLQNTVADLKEKVAAFDQRLTEQVVAPPADTRAVQEAIKEELAKIEQLTTESIGKMGLTVTEGFQKVNAVVEAQPKSVVRQLRFVFYPEYKSENYRFTLSRILLWTIAILVVFMLFTLAQERMGYR